MKISYSIYKAAEKEVAKYKARRDKAIEEHEAKLAAFLEMECEKPLRAMPVKDKPVQLDLERDTALSVVERDFEDLTKAA